MRIKLTTAEVKNLILDGSSKIKRVTFNKKDGSVRNMSVNTRFIKGIVDKYKSERTKQSVETRKKNNPNLISVMDITLKRKGEPDYKCWRSINLETVTQIKSGGKVLDVEIVG